jgi:hypothetical protein
VHDALAVRRGEAASHLQPPVDRLLLRDRSTVDLAAQRLALQQLGHGIGDTVGLAEVMDGEDVRVRERGDRLRLGLEP